MNLRETTRSSFDQFEQLIGYPVDFAEDPMNLDLGKAQARETDVGQSQTIIAGDEVPSRALGPASSTAVLDTPIDDLGLSVRSYNCLKRSGVDTIGKLLIILPQGHSAIRGAGVKTWSEIEEALAQSICAYETYIDNLQAEVEPLPLPTAFANDLHIGTSIDALELSPTIIDALRHHDITNIQTLAALPLSRLAQIIELSTLTHDNWFDLIRTIKYCAASENVRIVSQDTKPKTSLLALNLSARPFNCLARAGILDYETLADCTLVNLVNLRGFGAKSIEELSAKMRDALNSGAITVDDEVLHTSQFGVQSSPLAETPTYTPTIETEPNGPESSEAQAPDARSLDERLSAWFGNLDKRQCQVVQWRYGLIDGQELTLKEIGKNLKLSRERVRQIESVALQQLQAPSSQQAVSGLVARLHAMIVREGGMMSEADLGETLTSTVEVEDVDPQGALRLILGCNGKHIKIKGTQVWCLPEYSTLIPLVDAELVGILRQALAPISAGEILQRFKQTQLFREYRDDLNDKLVLACLRVSDKVIELEDSHFGLESWQRHWQDDIVLALRRSGHPMHYTAIADEINASHQDGQHITARAVHVRLMQHPEIFVWVRRKGTYGLKEWGIERSLSYADALTQILNDTGHPLTFTEILADLVKLRPYYDEASVQITLGINGRFRAFPNNTFGLTQWQEEDFAGKNYRVRRLFENSEEVALPKTKQGVVESLRTVDDFIARIRDNCDG